MLFHIENKSVFTLQRDESNLSIGEAAGKRPSFSCLFCMYSLASSCFNSSVIQKVQETTIIVENL